MHPRLKLPVSLAAAFGMIAFAGVILGGSATAQADGDACTTARFQLPQVEKACKEGGRAAAKKVMNAAMKKAKEAGAAVNCKSCHDDVKDHFALKANAVADLKRLLE